MHHARVVPHSGPLALESEMSMAAKCAYVEKVGAVYYVRKRIPRAWSERAEGEVVRLSLRTKDQVTAIKRGLELLRMEPKDALMHLTRRPIAPVWAFASDQAGRWRGVDRNGVDVASGPAAALL